MSSANTMFVLWVFSCVVGFAEEYMDKRESSIKYMQESEQFQLTNVYFMHLKLLE
jgi:hypothetical protein